MLLWLVLFIVCFIKPMSGGTVQTRTGKVDQTMKFKCTEAAHDLVWEVFLKFTSTSFLLYSSTPILYLIPLVLKYTYTLPDSTCTQVHLYSTWFRVYSSTPILYLIPHVLKYTYTLPDSACTQVTYTLPDSACTQIHLYSTWFHMYSCTPILYLIPLVLNYTYTLPDSVCTQVLCYTLYLFTLIFVGWRWCSWMSDYKRRKLWRFSFRIYLGTTMLSLAERGTS